MTKSAKQLADEIRQQLEQASDSTDGTVRESEILAVPFYPEDRDEAVTDTTEEEVEALVQAVRQQLTPQPTQQDDPIGYVSNARNAISRSDAFHFWSPAEETSLGIGSLVRHIATDPTKQQEVETYGIITKTGGLTAGLEDFIIHVYEEDARPPLNSIIPAPSRRWPVVNHETKVLASTQVVQRPVLSGPVYAIKATELAQVHNHSDANWPGADHLLLGFYQDNNGNFGVFAEERDRVLGPKQGHVIFSGLPGAGKTSLFLTLVTSLYAQLRNLEEENTDEKEYVPRVATLAINIKGADLLFLDHLDDSELEEHDRKMWAAARVNVTERPFGRVITYVPLADDGLNRNTLRTNQAADQPDYSETREFAFGIQDLWPYLDLFFDQRSKAASNLLAEIYDLFKRTSADTPFTLASVLNFFKTTLLKRQADRDEEWRNHNLNVIRAVYQRLRSLISTLGGLIDATGTGFGLDRLTDLRPYDMIVLDFERIMANPRDPDVAESAIKIITAYVLNRLTEAMTRGTTPVDHVIVFADELNRLAPRQGNGGIGEYLAQIARTTRDRGIVLFGAGQFRSGINEDILKAASVHFSMQTPDYELNDRIYAALSPEFKALLSQLEPGETLLQYPSLRTAVLARFPRPFVFTGATKWRDELSPAQPRPMADCVHERLRRLDSDHPPQIDEIRQLLDGLNTQHKQVVKLLRNVEMESVLSSRTVRRTPWEQFSQLVREKFKQTGGTVAASSPTPVPSGFIDDEEDDWDV